MDGKRFDALSRTVASVGTRRGIVQLLGGLPLLGVLLTVVDDEQADARRGKSGRRRDDERNDVQADRHNRGHKHNNQKHNKKKHRKHDRRKKKHKHRCRPQSAAQTCTGRCAQVTNNCGTIIDCGPCDCGACPACQICDATTGHCQANPEFLGQDCGSPGQVCQDDGTCACDDSSCPTGQRCNGIACVCDGTSCPNGCCDSSRVCRINESTACGTGGGVCNRCSGECVDGACTCGSGCPVCQTCNPATGLCIPDPASEGDQCGDGRRCIGGQCICDGTSCPTGCCDDAEACHIDDVADCGTAGGICVPCAASGQACEDGACCTTAGGTATVAAPCCAGLNTCADGVCRVDCCAGVVCPAGECQNPGTCDPTTGLCSPPTPNTGASCNTGNVCEIGVCQNGDCTSSGINVGAPCGNGRDGQICQANGSCRCSSGSCGGCTCNEMSGQCGCDGGLQCSGLVCATPPTCQGFTADCDFNPECCSNGCSVNDRCLCSQSGEACYSDFDCCGNPPGIVCIGFVCQQT